MLIESWPGSMICRFRSIEQSRFFFEPVNFDFELADLLIKFRFESLFFLGVAFAPGREDIRQTLNGLLFPLRRYIRMNAVVSSDLIDRPLTFDRFQGDFHLECCGR